VKFELKLQVKIEITEAKSSWYQYRTRSEGIEKLKTHHRLDMRLDPATTPMGQPPIRLDRLPHVLGDELLDDIDKDLFFLVGPSLVLYHQIRSGSGTRYESRRRSEKKRSGDDLLVSDAWCGPFRGRRQPCVSLRRSSWEVRILS
jgi:hypothetical protein